VLKDKVDKTLIHDRIEYRTTGGIQRDKPFGKAHRIDRVYIIWYMAGNFLAGYTGNPSEIMKVNE
jgi:hypothetical protein